MSSKLINFKSRLDFLSGLVNNFLLLIGSILSLILILNIIFFSSSYQITIAQFMQGFFGFIILYLSIKKIIRKRFINLVTSEQNRKYILILPLITLAILFLYRITINDLEGYIRRISEGSLFEWFGFLFLFFSSFLLLKSSANNLGKMQKNILKIGSLIMFVWSMEEMSWGQMLFNWVPPKMINEINMQNETNIHNLRYIHDKSWLILLVIFSIFFIFSIIGSYLRSRGEIKIGSIADIIFPIGCTSSYFFFAALIYLGVVLLKSGIFVPILHTREQEIGELLFSLGFFIHSTNIYLNCSRD